MPFSQAGAAGRIALIEEAAKLLNVDKEVCNARNGAVSAGDRSITYGDIVARGSLNRTFSADQLKAMPIKKPADRRLIGHDTKAIDIPAKTNGAARYGIDAEVEGMVYARPKIPPTRYGSKVVSIDDSAAKSVKGYIKSIALDDPSDTVPGWVMVFADSFSAADRAADKVKVEWIPGDALKVSEQDLQDHGAKLIADPSGGSLLVDDPGVEAAFAAAKSTLQRTYTTSSVLHFQLEPVNALAFEKDGIFEIHTGNQWQSLILPVLARALAVGVDKVIMRTYLLGGGFGRRLNGDYAVPAALATKAIGKPVKMVCTRADDMLFDSFRSPSIQTLRMAFGEGGKVTALSRTISRTAPSARAIYARSARAGPIGRSKASWTKRRTRPALTLSRSASACLTAPAGMRARRRTRSAARGGRPQFSNAQRRKAAGAARCRRIPASASRRPLVRNARCRRGRRASPASASIGGAEM